MESYLRRRDRPTVAASDHRHVSIVVDPKP